VHNKETEKKIQNLVCFNVKDQELVPQFFNIGYEIPLVKKHEYIGANSFIFSTFCGLLFLASYKGNDLKISPQHLSFGPLNEGKDKKKYCPFQLISFSANQDDDKRTPAGRARFFALLVGYVENNVHYTKVVLMDLLHPLNQLFHLCTILKNKELFGNLRNQFFANDQNQNYEIDRISFGNNNSITLWNNNHLRPDAMQITLNESWPKTVSM
jgi:hypothetical protein